MGRIVAIAVLLALTTGLILFLGCAGKEKQQTQENPSTNVPAQMKDYSEQLSECGKLNDINRAKDFCITNIAIDKKDPAICDTNSDYKYECRAQVFAKLDRCLELSPPIYQAGCFIYMSEQQQNIGICDRIKEIDRNSWEDVRDDCYLNYYGIFNMTGSTKQKNNDPAICEGLLSRSGRNICYYNMAEAHGDASFCDKYVAESKGEIGSKDNCYFKIAMKKNKGELCDKISDYVYAQQQCYYRIAKEKSDASLCEKIPTGEEVRERLIQECLKDGGAEVTCSQISGQSLRKQCYYDIAAIQKDESVCEKLTDKYEKEYCQSLATEGSTSS